MTEKKQMTDMDLLAEDALVKMSELNKADNLAIVHSERDVIPSSGRSIFRFYAAKRDDQNGPHFSLAMDEDKNVIDLDKLMKTEKAALFAPMELGDFTLAPIPIHPPPAPITVSPNVNNLTLDPGEIFSEVITVTVPKDTGTPKWDVYFLSDTTGSMDSIIANVRIGANSILSALNIPVYDIAFGVGNYRDFPNDAYAFRHQLNPTKVTANVTNEINSWIADEGGDSLEAQLFALDKLAEPAGGAIGWRSGAKRIIVWIGDNPGHDPICSAISGLTYDITESSVTTKLVNEDIIVLAISTNAITGLDAVPTDPFNEYVGTCPIGGTAGQATRITSATGGTHSTGITPATIVTEIINLVTNAITKIGNLNLVPTGAIAPFVTSITPAGGYNDLPRNTSHLLNFNVQFTGVAPCSDHDQVFSGTIDVVADSIVVAKKDVIITVLQCDKYVYSVKFVCGIQEDELADAVRPGIYATDINIHNFHNVKVRIRKYVLPLIMGGNVCGREPDFSGRKADDSIILPPYTATMDDCQRIGQLLFGGISTTPMPITVGFFEIRSPKKLNVTAVYTATDHRSGSVSIDVEQIKPMDIDLERKPD